ncbi:hypothetical protein HDU90_004664 [Geranomyces variabilis]|nr:hypothetical protein HDU90_004664 [Geranomyces variabilis]
MPTESRTSPSSPAPTSSAARKTDHVNFIVHGMGRQRRYVQNMESMRQACKEVLRVEFPDQEIKIEWIPISWHEALHDLSSVDGRMNLITLPTCSILRAINNDVLADVLYYFSSFHGQTILNIVAQKLNQAYDDFRQANPGFDGQINLIGHSLGGVILYDLLANIRPAQAAGQAGVSGEPPRPHFEISYPQLAFRPSALFTLGSPVGAVIVMRGQNLSTYRPPRDILFHNLFNILDPLCYRVEPLLNSEYTAVPPILIQRPSARVPTLTYYRQLISSYLPDLPSPMAAGMSMSSLQLPLGNLKANMAGVMDGLYASVWAAGGFWDDDANAQMDENVRLAAADDAEEDWAPRKRRRIKEDERETPTTSGAAADEPVYQDEMHPHASSSHKRKRVHERAESEPPNRPDTGKTTGLPRRTPRELVSTLTGGVAGSVSSMADAVYNFLSLGSARLAGADEGNDPNSVVQESAQTVTNFVDELVGREEIVRMAEHDAEQGGSAQPTSNPDGSPEPHIPSPENETKHIDPPPHRLDYYISDPMIGTVFQQFPGLCGGTLD